MMSMPLLARMGLRVSGIASNSAFGFAIRIGAGILATLDMGILAIYLPFLAVLALSRNALAVGAPLVPGLRIFSPDPAFMRAFLAAMLAYSPGFMSISTFSN